MLYLNTDIQNYNEERLSCILESLPSWRKEQALRFRHLSGKRECALAYMELMRGLREEYGITKPPHFVLGEHGKPSLKEHPDIHFNLSHCNLAVGCLISSHPCGLDIECIRPAKEDLVRYCMNDKETDLILSSPTPDFLFTQLWTQKEAVVKLLSTGIDDNLKNVLDLAKEEGIILKTTSFPTIGIIITEATSLQSRA